MGWYGRDVRLGGVGWDGMGLGLVVWDGLRCDRVGPGVIESIGGPNSNRIAIT